MTFRSLGSPSIFLNYLSIYRNIFLTGQTSCAFPSAWLNSVMTVYDSLWQVGMLKKLLLGSVNYYFSLTLCPLPYIIDYPHQSTSVNKFRIIKSSHGMIWKCIRKYKKFSRSTFTSAKKNRSQTSLQMSSSVDTFQPPPCPRFFPKPPSRKLQNCLSSFDFWILNTSIYLFHSQIVCHYINNNDLTYAIKYFCWNMKN